MERRSSLPSLFGGALGRRDVDPFMALRREMDRLFDEAFQGFGRPAATAALAPSIDVSETDDAIKVCADLPGVNEDDIDLTLTGDTLTIRGEKRQDRDERRENIHISERSFGAFSRTIRLPFEAEPEQVRAEFDNGVLTVTVAKPPGAPGQSRRIEVKGRRVDQATGGQQGLREAANAMRGADQPAPPPSGSAGSGGEQGQGETSNPAEIATPG